MNTTEIKARIYDLLVLIEQAKSEIKQLEVHLETQKNDNNNPE